MVRAKLIALILLAMVELTFQHLRAQDVTELPRSNTVERLLVLRNGGLVEGFIRRERDHYSVQTRTGSRLVISLDETSFVCGTLEEAYWGKLARLKATDHAGQISLFRWCIQQKLSTLAENQYMILEGLKIAPNDLDFMKRQLVMAQRERNNPPTVPTQQANATSSNSRLPFEELEPVFSPLPSIQTNLSSEIRQVGYEEPGKEDVPMARANPSQMKTGAEFNSPKGESFPATIRRPGTLTEPEMLSDLELRNAQRLNANATHIAMPSADLAAVPDWPPPLPASLPPAADSKTVSPLGSQIGEIPQLNSRPAVFRPRDEFDPEIFNRECLP